MMKISIRRNRTDDGVSQASRITNETVAEHREEVLAGGRRYKYPMQYAKHRLVAIAVLIGSVSLIMAIVFTWFQLYVEQSSNVILYRITQAVPIPVASVDGQSVKYSDYLMYYRSSIHFLEKNNQLVSSDENGRRQIELQKRQNLDVAIKNAYVAKLAKELNIKVEPDQLEKANKQHLIMANGTISQEAYSASTFNLLGWTTEEEQQATINQILKNSVAYEIDIKAQQLAEQATKLVQTTDLSFDKVAESIGGEGGNKVVAGKSGMVPIINNDGGLTDAARNLSVGQRSTLLRSTTGDGYYFIKLLSKDENELSYEFLRIPLTELDDRMIKLRQDGKIKEYIKIPFINGS